MWFHKSTAAGGGAVFSRDELGSDSGLFSDVQYKIRIPCIILQNIIQAWEKNRSGAGQGLSLRAATAIIV
jgi:hypothetical protein